MRKVYGLLIFFGLAVSLNAQTADRIESLLNKQAVNYGEAAMFVLEAADVQTRSGAGVVSSPAEAFRFASEQNWMPAGATAGNPATLDGVSLLIMRSFGLKGGIFYTLTKSPHYAYRELLYRDIIQGRTEPQMPVSGDFLLFVINRALANIEGE